MNFELSDGVKESVGEQFIFCQFVDIISIETTTQHSEDGLIRRPVPCNRFQWTNVQINCGIDCLIDIIEFSLRQKKTKNRIEHGKSLKRNKL